MSFENSFLSHFLEAWVIFQDQSFLLLTRETSCLLRRLLQMATLVHYMCDLFCFVLFYWGSHVAQIGLQFPMSLTMTLNSRCSGLYLLSAGWQRAPPCPVSHADSKRSSAVEKTLIFHPGALLTVVALDRSLNPIGSMSITVTVTGDLWRLGLGMQIRNPGQGLTPAGIDEKHETLKLSLNTSYKMI